MKKTYKSIEQLIEEKNSFITAIPNNLGINLCSVKGIVYNRKKDGQLKTLKIIFIPAEKEEENNNITNPENVGQSNVNTNPTNVDKSDLFFNQQTRLTCIDMATRVVSQSSFSLGGKTHQEAIVDVAKILYDFIIKGEN